MNQNIIRFCVVPDFSNLIFQVVETLTTSTTVDNDERIDQRCPSKSQRFSAYVMLTSILYDALLNNRTDFKSDTNIKQSFDTINR